VCVVCDGREDVEFRYMRVYRREKKKTGSWQREELRGLEIVKKKGEYMRLDLASDSKKCELKKKNERDDLQL
jgi:hypothetical protein